MLYVELPEGQVSFHSAVEYEGPEYDGEWDGDHKSEQRLLKVADAVMAQAITPGDRKHNESRRTR